MTDDQVLYHVQQFKCAKDEESWRRMAALPAEEALKPGPADIWLAENGFRSGDIMGHRVICRRMARAICMSYLPEQRTLEKINAWMGADKIAL